MERPDDLEELKRMDLREYAAGHFGYYVDERECYTDHTVMRHADGSKICIMVSGDDGHFLYCNMHTPDQSGSIIDFVMHHAGFRTVGEALGHLRRDAAQGHRMASPEPQTFPTLSPVVKDLEAVAEQLGACFPLHEGCLAYLNHVRKLPASFLDHASLQEAIRTDDRGNAVFVHHDFDGECGAELRNTRFKSYMKSATKGLWFNRSQVGMDTLALFESGEDALAWAFLHGIDGVRLLSTSGNLSPNQPALIASAIQKFPRGRVVLGFDNDEGGDRLCDMVSNIFQSVGRTDLKLEVHRPTERGFDWMDCHLGRKPDLGPLLHKPEFP